MKNADMPAMPLPLGGETTEGQQGLTKREMMAMHMMAGLLSSSTNASHSEFAEESVKSADALLAELERTKCQS